MKITNLFLKSQANEIKLVTIITPRNVKLDSLTVCEFVNIFILKKEVLPYCRLHVLLLLFPSTPFLDDCPFSEFTVVASDFCTAFEVEATGSFCFSVFSVLKVELELTLLSTFFVESAAFFSFVATEENDINRNGISLIYK